MAGGFDYFKVYGEEHRQDRALYQNASVSFSLEAVEDTEASKLAGHVVYKDMELIIVTFPGDPPLKFPVEEKHRRSYPREYQAFKDGQELPIEGTPLEFWPMASKGVVANLKQNGIRTVEQLACVDGEAQRRLRSLSEWIPKAKRWLEERSKNAGVSRIMALESQVEELKEYIKAQDNLVASLLQRIDASEGTDMSKTHKATDLSKFGGRTVKPEDVAEPKPEEVKGYKRRGRPKKTVQDYIVEAKV